MNIFKVIGQCIKYGDKILWAIIALICVYSLFVVKSISRETFNYFTVQFLSVVIGLTGAVLLQAVNYKVLASKWKWIAFISVVLMIYTLFVGVKVEGSMGINARAWIRLPGGITFQPSELVKIGFMITFANHLAQVKKKKDGFYDLKNIALLGVHVLVPMALAHLQGDDGAAIIFMCIALTMMFMAELPLRYFIMMIAFAGISAPFMWNFVLADYQKRRMITQLNPEADPLNMGYQQIQGKLSIGSGGLFGYGLFEGPRVAKGVVPVQESDFIFAAVGEELGFIGCLVLFCLILIFVWRICFIARHCGETVGMLICFGFVGLIVSQSVFNLGMCLSLLPVMGVTLPFFSVGGSSAACLYLGIGLIQSVYLNRDETRKILDIQEWCE